MSQLLLCRTFPPMVGGVERYISELFRRARIEIHVLAPRLPGASEFDQTIPYGVTRYPFVRARQRGKLPLLPLAIWAAWLAARQQPRAVYSDQVQSGAVGVPLSRLLGAAHVTFAYGLELSPLRLFRLKRAVFARSSAVVAISRFTRDSLVSVYGVPPERIHLARPGVDVNRFAPHAGAITQRAILGLEPGDLVLLTVGRLDASQRYKGYDRVIRLASRLQAEFPRLRLLIVGEGDDRFRLEKLARDEGVASHVMFMGGVSDEQLPMLYRIADLFVLPSGAPETDPFCVEGYGIAFAEAAASGVPSVGYRLGGVSDAVEDGVTGVLTTPTEDALTAAVRHLLREAQLRLEMGRAAREHAVRELGWDAAVATLRNLSSRLTSDTTPPRGSRKPRVSPTSLFLS